MLKFVAILLLLLFHRNLFITNFTDVRDIISLDWIDLNWVRKRFYAISIIIIIRCNYIVTLNIMCLSSLPPTITNCCY